MKVYKKGEIIKCPRCGDHPAGEPLPVDDFVVPGSDIGVIERSECWECYRDFDVEVAVNGEFHVS